MIHKGLIFLFGGTIWELGIVLESGRVADRAVAAGLAIPGKCAFLVLHVGLLSV